MVHYIITLGDRMFLNLWILLALNKTSKLFYNIFLEIFHSHHVISFDFFVCVIIMKMIFQVCPIDLLNILYVPLTPTISKKKYEKLLWLIKNAKRSNTILQFDLLYSFSRAYSTYRITNTFILLNSKELSE